MFNWFDEKIDEFFQKRTKKMEEEIELEIMSSQQALETHCDTYTRITQEKFRTCRDEFEEFVDANLDRLKADFIRECESQDLAEIFKKCFNEYVETQSFSTNPIFVETTEELEKYDYTFIKVASIVLKENYQGSGNKETFKDSVRRALRNEAIKRGLKLGGKMGADLMTMEIKNSVFSKWQSWGGSQKSTDLEIVANYSFYTISGFSKSSEEKEKELSEKEEMLIGGFNDEIMDSEYDKSEEEDV